MLRMLVTCLLCVLASGGTCQTIDIRPGRPFTCQEASGASPGVGNSFASTIENRDYGFSAEIPVGLTAWTGTAVDAPFHGFTIFLDDDRDSCIVFEVHIRLGQATKSRAPRGSKEFQLGSAEGWQTIVTSNRKKSGMANLAIDFSNRRGEERDDGQILLIAPTRKLNAGKSLYDAFVRSVRFEH